MTRTVGLLLVHGIGNQHPGDLSRAVASVLADHGQKNGAGLSERAASGAANADGHPGETYSFEWLTVGTTRVAVAEANWSALSSPDNPPRVRLANPIVRDYLEMVPTTWRSSPLRAILRRLGRRTFPACSSFLLLVAAVLSVGLLIWSFVPTWFGAGDGAEPARWLWRLFGVLLMGIAAHLAIRAARYRRLQLRHAPQWRRFSEAAVWGIVAFCVGLGRVVFGLIVAGEALAFFAMPVAFAYVISAVSAVVAGAVRSLAATMTSRPLAGVQRWFYRLTWVMLVLPCHALLGATRAAGNLLSVILAERAWRPRPAATAGMVGVYVPFLVLLALCEFLAFPVVIFIVLFGLGETTADQTLAGSLAGIGLLLPVHMRMIKGCLPAIDLLLDVANYHLANDAERHEYHDRIEWAVEALLHEGCEEIHLLAHSLGTVLVYDWLRSSSPGQHPIAMLYTIGSPLEKFWYLDHGAAQRRADRGGLGGYVSRAWLNFWAWSDPVSGRLRHYNCTALPVANKAIPRLGPILRSHVRYWKDDAVLGEVRRRLAE